MKTTEESPGFETVEWVESVPVDLAIVLTYLVAADLSLLWLPDSPVAVQTLIGLPLVFFVPGYAVLAALFPGRGTGRADASGWFAVRETGIGRRERAPFAFGVSVALLPLLAVGLSASGAGFQRVPVLATLTAVTVVGCVVGAVRRRRLPEHARFEFPLGSWFDDLSATVTGPGGIVYAVLFLAVVAAVASLAFATAAPMSGESYTGFALLTASDDGDLVAGNYPTRFTAGEPRSLVVSVENHEGERTRYTIVATVQRVRSEGGQVTVLEERELNRTSITVDEGARWRDRRSVAPAMVGDDLRLQYLLYKGTAPADPSAESAYRHLHIWISVDRGSGTGGGGTGGGTNGSASGANESASSAIANV